MTKVKLLVTGVLIVGGLAAVLLAAWSLTGYSRVELTLALTCLFLGLAQLVSHLSRVRERAETVREIEDLGEATTRLAREFQDFRTGNGGLDDDVQQQLQDLDRKVVSQLRTLEALVEQHSGNGAPPPAGQALPAGDEAMPEAEQGLREEIADSVAAGRLELYLQPVISLPQREIRFYQAQAFIRGAEDRLIAPQDYLAVTRDSGPAADLDLFCVRHAMRLLPELKKNDPEIGLISPLSVQSLNRPEFLTHLQDFIGKHKDPADAVIFEFRQSELEAAGSLERESLEALAKLGLRFILSDIQTLDIDYPSLARHGFIFIKLSAETLVSRLEFVLSPVRAEDLAALLARNGLSLLIDQIDSEGDVANLQQFNIEYGLGDLFASPKPIRDVTNGKAGLAKSASA
jgi:cyclic-di-GMP phosphodiesterase TipF (flagellum assembly factor)